MEQLTTKEFMDKLQADSLKTCTVTGLAKKSGNAAEILFKTIHADGDWIKLPASLIGSVVFLEHKDCSGEPCVLVKLHLTQPSTPESKVLYELLSALSLHRGCKCHGHEFCNGCHCASENATGVCRCGLLEFPSFACGCDRAFHKSAGFGSHC